MAEDIKLAQFTESQPGTTDHSKVIALDGLYQTADATRRKFEPDWLTNCLFLAGNQWEAAVDDVRRWGRTVVPSTQTGKTKIVDNTILPLARQAASSLRQHIAQQVATSATGDEADMQAAELATDFLQSRHYEDREDELRFMEILWAMCVGRVLRKTYWDPEADGFGVTGKTQGLGDIASKTLNPFRFHTCPWSESSDDMPWIIESDVRDIEEINDLWPGHDVEAEEYSDATRNLDRLLTNIVGQGSGDSTSQRKKAAILKRMYAKPTRKQPEGKLYVWANGKLLQEETLPEGEMPFSAIDWFPIPGRAYPLPFVTPLRDLQREINITLSQLIELKNRQLRGDLITDSVTEPTQETGKDGRKIIRVQPGSSFKFMEYNLNSSEAESMLNQLRNESMQLAGIHESALGQQASGKVTATQVAILKESDMSGLTMFREGFDITYCKISRLKLLLAKNHYHVPRMIRVVGESNNVRTAAFFGSDLRNTEDVRPRTAPILTETQKAEAKAQASAQGLFVLEGTPAQIWGKVSALLTTPGIEREDVEGMIAPMSIDDLRSTAAQWTALSMQAQMQALSMQLAQSQPQPGMGGEAEQPIDQFGNPVQPEPMQEQLPQ